MREPIAFPAQLTPLLRADLTRMLGEAAERVAVLALYSCDPELDHRLGEELWALDAARKLLRKLHNASGRPYPVIGLTLDDHPALVARLFEKRLQQEIQRAQDVEARGEVPQTETTREIERFLAHLATHLIGSERLSREEARLNHRPQARPRSPRPVVQRREAGQCR